MKTVKIYENNVYSRTCDAALTDVRCERMSASEGADTPVRVQVCFDRTVFFPEGGGQSPDTGTVVLKDDPEHPYTVTDVQEQDGLVWHTLEPAGRGGQSPDGRTDPRPGGNDEPDERPALEACGNDEPDGRPALEAGAEATLTIDWDHRFDNMQRHLGEHILSGAFYRLFGAVNKGFHMGDNFMTVDFGFDGDDAGAKRITWEMAMEAELEANRVIWKDAPVRRDHFDTREEAEKLPLRKHLAFDEDISIITVADDERVYDCVACCGTHPSSAGQVGLIKILKIEPNKGMSRVYLEAGERAFRLLRKDFDTLYDVSGRLSAGADDVEKKFDAYVKSADEMKDELYKLKRSVIQSETEKLLSDGAPVTIAETGLGADDIMQITKSLLNGKRSEGGQSGGRGEDRQPGGCEAGSERSGSRGASDRLFVILSRPACTAILCSASGEYDCGAIIKEKAPAFGGKGGGSDKLARAKFDSPERMREFADSLS